MLPKEKNLEEAIENYLVSIGYEQGHSQEFDLSSCLFTEDLFRFLEKTQKELLDEFKYNRGSNYKKAFVDLVNSNIRARGLISVLRNGVEDMMMNGKFQLFYNKPNLTTNKTDYKNYKQNIFKVTRQLKYSDKHNNTLDMVLSLNGFPLIVMELKNQFTNQNVYNAIKQFKEDRNPKESMFEFNRRVLVYFAVDTDEVYMTTELKGKNTYFLPFNKGNNRGKGNPPVEGKEKTSYLWEEILTKDSLLDIVKRFYFIEKDGTRDRRAIFPRFHQLDAVRKIVSDLKINKAGKNYLIQHSAGSGKTNTIAWTAHRLSSLHDENNDAIFDSVIVVTDRKVLDKQLQDAIYQLEHKHGLVVKIDDKKNSSDLADAINNRAKIIITTIQKFQYALPKIENHEKCKGNKANLHIMRFIILGTYLNFSNNLYDNNNNRIKKSSLSKIWHTKNNRKSVNETFEILKETEYITETEEGFIMLNNSLITKGEIENLNELKNDKNATYTRLFSKNIQDMFLNTNISSRKQLANLFKILPYVNFKYNALCFNPDETDIKKIERLNWTDIAEICGYENNKNITKFKRDLMNLKIYGYEAIGQFETGNGKTIYVNPKIFYSGSDVDDVKRLYTMFDMHEK